MNETIQIYVKATSNCEGMPLQTFELLSSTWTGDKIRLPFGKPLNAKRLDVVGWTDLFNGQACPVNVAKVRAGDLVGWLVWGGNSGMRILDKNAPVTPGVDDHLPRGFGQAIIWLTDAQDLPAEARKVVKV